MDKDTPSRPLATTGQPRRAVLPPGPPLLQVIVDTEEEFDWEAPFNRDSITVRSVDAQAGMVPVFARHGLTPTYVVDYPVATTPSAIAALRSIFDAGQCLIGAHLQPWVNPPAEETVSVANSYPGNLPAELERRKLGVLTDAIEAAFGQRPTIYKAGRYGLGPATAETLAALGYEIDLSVVPHSDMRRRSGPDFRFWPDRPSWFGPANALFEIPLTRGFAGRWAGRGPALFPATQTLAGRTLRLGSLLARGGLLERITLTPEGSTLSEQKRLLHAMRDAGHRVFSLTYHSPSLMPGCTPYVRTSNDLQRFQDTIVGLLDYFFGSFGGQPTTPPALRAMALAAGHPGA